MTHDTGNHDTCLITTPAHRSPLLRPRVLVPVAVAALTVGFGFGLTGAEGSHREGSTAVAGEPPAPAPVDTSLSKAPVLVTETVDDERSSPSATGALPPPPAPGEPGEATNTKENKKEEEPEPLPQPGPAAFEVPDAVVLPTNVYSGSFVITNTGGEAFEWKAFNFVGTKVHTPAGSLEPGEQATISFTVDHSDLEDGSFPELTGVEVDVDGVGAKQVRVKGLKLTTIVAPA